MTRSPTVLKKSGSPEEFHKIGYECLPSGQYRLADVFHTSDEYPIIVFEQSFSSERDANDALELRLKVTSPSFCTTTNERVYVPFKLGDIVRCRSIVGRAAARPNIPNVIDATFSTTPNWDDSKRGWRIDVDKSCGC